MLHIILVIMAVGLVCFVLAFLLDWFDGSDMTPPKPPRR
jgi:phosphatidylglycerophosphate synthase